MMTSALLLWIGTSMALAQDCPVGQQPDCLGTCGQISWHGDGICDDGTWGVDYACPAFGNDGGDCDSGVACPAGFEPDCNGTCAPSVWLGDGVCDNGVAGTDFACADFAYDGGDCPNDGGCAPGQMLDCEGACVPESWLGDGVCDDGTYGAVFTCPEFVWDELDCPVPCSEGETLSCDGQCVPATLVGDGFCDDGFWLGDDNVGIDLRCDAHGADGGDCDGSGGDLVDIEAGWAHVCATTTTGEVRCRNAGQVPIEPGPGPFTELTGGAYSGCGIDADGLAQCWGVDTTKNGTPAIDVALPFFGVCLLDPAGQLSCSDDAMQSGFDWYPTEPQGTFVSIEGGAAGVCGRDASGEVTCFTDLNSASLFDMIPPSSQSLAGYSVGYEGICVLEDSGYATCTRHGNAWQQMTSVVDGGAYACGITVDSTVACWGNHPLGLPGPDPEEMGYTDVAAENAFTCAVKGGEVRCWGILYTPLTE